MTLAERIESLFDQTPLTTDHEAAFAELLAALQLGEADIAQGRTRTYSKELVQGIRERALSRAASGEKPKSDAAP